MILFGSNFFSNCYKIDLYLTKTIDFTLIFNNQIYYLSIKQFIFNLIPKNIKIIY
jgi:hypothetical protein